MLAYVKVFHKAWALERARDTGRELAAEKRVAEIRRHSSQLIDAIEEGTATADMKARLMIRDAERADLEAQLTALKVDVLPQGSERGAPIDLVLHSRSRLF